jgi:hypothetical protein
MTTYEAYRRNKIESGLLYQDFVVDTLSHTIGLIIQVYSSRVYQYAIGESRQGIEIKHDELYAHTGNLWIEISEKAVPRDGDYCPSGIFRRDNSWLYVIGDYDTIFIFPQVHLRALVSAKRFPIEENKTRTSQGFRLRDDFARKYAAYVITPNASEQVQKAVGNLEKLGRILHAMATANPAQGSLFEHFTNDDV